MGYVDNMFVVWPHKDYHLNEFHDDLNNQHPSIQFTMEEESDNKIALLDILVERKGTTVLASVFRKKTHTNHYLNLSPITTPEGGEALSSVSRAELKRLVMCQSASVKLPTSAKCSLPMGTLTDR